MIVFYIAYFEEKVLKLEAFGNKEELNAFVQALKKLNIVKYKVVKLQNNTSIKDFIDFVSHDKLNESYHRMMQKAKTQNS